MREKQSPKKRTNGKKPSAKRSKEQNAIIVLGAAVVLVLISIVSYIMIHQSREAKEIAAQTAAEEAIRHQQSLAVASFEQFVASDTFLEGITIEGVGIGGMTLEQARAALAPRLQSFLPVGDLKLTYGGTEYLLDKSSIAATVNIDEALSSAFQIARNGDYEENKALMEDIKANGRDFTLTVSYDFEQVMVRVREIASVIDVAPQDASVYIESADERKIGFRAQVEGVSVMQDALAQTITDAILNDSTDPIEIPVTLVPPAITEDVLASMYQLRAKATTSFKGSASTRKYNIRKGAGMINGTVLKPGQVFSANDTLGVRTSSNGWKIAGAYESGATVQQAGGGVCQLSSTLYNAAVKADLEIVFRKNHSMPVSYVSQGLDATINSVGNIIDFKFKNNASSDIVIFAYTSGDNLTFEIYGPPFATSEYDEIKLTSKRLETLQPSNEIVYIFDETLEPGTEVVNVNRQNGSRWQSYKHYYKNGVEIRKEKLDQSTYKSFAGEVLVGPSPSPTLIPTPTAEPTITPPTVTVPVDTPTPTPTPTPPPTPTPTPTQSADPTATPTADPTTEPPTDPTTDPDAAIVPADP